MPANRFPSAREIIDEALAANPHADINQLHALTYTIMLRHKSSYYSSRVDNFLERPYFRKMPIPLKESLKEELLKPVKGGGILYSNMMEEASRRISQTFQSISGNIAEDCVERELNSAGLTKNLHYKTKFQHTDFFIFHPDISNPQKTHRLEVKNVKLRERGARGLAFDGDSILGFFDDPDEFTTENIELINNSCIKTGGYCYLPPKLIKKLDTRIAGKRFKPNTKVVSDMKDFVDSGVI